MRKVDDNGVPVFTLRMVDLTISLSGLRASQTRLSTSAHNTANLSTDGFRRHRTVQSEASPGQGTRTRVDIVDLSAKALERAESLPGAQNNVRIVSETVARISAQRAFEAGVRTIRAQYSTLQTLIDELA